ncbi:MAG: glycosyltransferase family 4 protein [Gammaproteobacteria bacterium]|nr:glycosyltransferase family 4 protein [Gammaproteobacteria bacterium]
MSWLWLPVAAAFLIGLLGTGWIRRYALQRSLIDVPNDRSSHTVPTPRGGGLSLALAYLLGLLLLHFHTDLQPAYVIPLGMGLFVAAVGWREDHRHIPQLWRGLLYLSAAALAVIAAGGLPVIDLGVVSLHWGHIGSVLAVLGIAWLTNLYNFMDGADALAGLQAVTAGLAGGLMFFWAGAPGPALVALILAGAAAGFLCWNWPPAKIFMGDVGSCLLGFAFGVLALVGELQGTVPVLVWLILLSFFVWDATLTLAARILAGENWYQAHRAHAYQRLLQMGWSHRRLALAFLGGNVLILWPLAAWAYWYREAMIAAALLASLLAIITWYAVRRAHNVNISGGSE